MTLALLFPGQGAQHAAMLPWLDTDPAAATMLAALQDAVGADWRTRLHDADWAARNAVAQTLLTGIGLATWQALAPHLPPPSVVAGYSVGELAAFAAAGVLDTAHAVALASVRAALMDQAAAGTDTGLLSVHGLRADALGRTCEQHRLALAIRIAPDRAIVGGRSADLDAAQAELAQAGAQCTRLPVRVASHTPWMRPAAEAFAEHLRHTTLQTATTVLVCNHTGSAQRTSADLATALAAQIASPVPWDTCMDTVAERRPRCVLEVGPGQALSRMWAERHPEIPVRSADDFRSAQAAGRWVAAHLR